jgi:hypothetical protein
MTENFLNYLWKHKLIGPNLRLSSGETLIVADPGQRNQDSGPDFFNARIRIANTLWAGNVEVHVRSSDWWRHGHHSDKAYASIVLHVVYENDRQVYDARGRALPTLVLAGSISGELHAIYQQLMRNRSWVPCAHLISYAGRLVIHNWLDRMLAERFDRKASEIKRVLDMNQNNWNETFYQALARNLGFKTNALPFELLAKSLPFGIVRKHIGNLFQLEALLFGQAGMLSAGRRIPYYRSLRKEYEFLAAKYGLVPIDAHLWKFMRMRPSNFPTLRIAQFAAFLNASAFSFADLLETISISKLKASLYVSASDFWRDHYSFKARSPKMSKSIGDQAVKVILINTMIPFLYVYGKIKKQSQLVERALAFLDQLPGERNNIISGWRGLGLGVGSAYTSQALIELKTRYCQRKKCLECAIGHSLLRGVGGLPQTEK